MSQDFEESLGSLNARKVRYLIGGAHAERFIQALSDFFGGNFGPLNGGRASRHDVAARERGLVGGRHADRYS